MRHRVVAAVVLASCGGRSATPESPDPPPYRFAVGPRLRCGHGSPELSPALDRLAWWIGDWTSDRSDEHWVAAGGAIYGISFDHQHGGFEVMIVDDGDGPGKPDGKLRLIAIPYDAQESTQFDHDGKRGELEITFANPTHDYPKQITYGSRGDLTASVGDGEKSEGFRWKCSDIDTRAEVLEEADRAFAADTAKRGVDGWVDAFAKDGAMLRRGKRVEGADAIREAIAPLLSSGKLAWTPIARGIDGNIGYTVGKATCTGSEPKDHWKSTYVTIWRSRNDGPWKVAFDTGRVVNE